jgi:integrase
MPKVKLTAAFCASAECAPGKKKTDYWDCGPGSIPGFVYEKRCTGRGSWYLRYGQGSSQRQHLIGGDNSISYQQARDAAKRLRADVVLGGDPVARKQQRKAIGTYADLAKLHIEEAKRTQRSWWSTEHIVNKKLVSRFGKSRLDEISPKEIAKWLGELAASGLKEATIDKYRVVLGRSYELGRRWGVAGTEINPVRSVPRRAYDNARQRYLTAEEAQRLKWACELSANKSLSALVGLWVLTGTRKRELLDTKWRDVDLERRLLRVPRSKSGRARHVPLSQAAIDIIERLPRKEGCPWLVPNPSTGKPWVSIKRAWKKAIEEADLPGLRIHDLRHSCASFLAAAGVDLFQIGRVLGHAAHSSTTARYAHLANDTLLAAVEAGASKLSFGWAEPTA